MLRSKYILGDFYYKQCSSVQHSLAHQPYSDAFQWHLMLCVTYELVILSGYNHSGFYHLLLYNTEY